MKRIAFSLVLLFGCIACGKPTTSTESSPTITASASTADDPYEGWKVFTSAREGLSFKYPPDWTIDRKTFETGKSGREGETAIVTSPSGFRLSWTAPLIEVGGGCEADQQAHVFVDHVYPLTQIESARALFVIVARVEDHKRLAVVDRFPRAEVPQVGDSGECLTYPTFRSKSHADLDAVQFMSGNAPQISSNGIYADEDRSAQMSDAEYLDQPDVHDALLIFRSLRY